MNPGATLRTRAEYLLAVALFETLKLLPLPAAHATARAITRLLDRAAPRLRRVALKNLSFAMPELDLRQRDRIVDGVFRSIARLLVALARFPSIGAANISDWIAYEGLEHYRQAKQQGRGVLIATGHLGNWELSAFAHALMTEPMYVMVRPLDNPFIDHLIENRRRLSGNRAINKRVAARAVMKALKCNQPVGVLIDQNTAANEGVFVDFFGKLACASSAFVKLAYHSEAAVVPGFALWDQHNRRYVLRFYPPIEMTGDVQIDTQRIHSFLEQIIRQYPDQWMWIHRRWRTRPAGENPIY